MIRFADPLYISLIILLLPMLFFGRKAGGRIRFSSIATLKKVTHTHQFHPRQLLILLRVVAIICLVFAIARPQSGKKFSEVTSQGVDIVLAIDTSGSMEALDFKENDKPVNRLHIVKKVVADFIDKRGADRIGLVVFGEEAYTQCPLTLDHGILLDFLKRLEIGMAGNATAIGSAVGTAIKRMKDLKSKSKIMILLTDGRSNAGRLPPLKASELANTYDIKIYTIGVGTKGKAPFLMDTIFGKRYTYQDVDIDEKTLTEMAEKTGAKYYRATDTQELAKIYEEIDKLEKTEVKVREYTEYHELFHWFLIPGLLLLLLEILLANTRLRKIP